MKSFDWVPHILRVGFAFLHLRALAGCWSRILGVVRPGRDGSLIFFRDSPPPLSRPDIVTDVRAVSPWSLALCQLALGVLSLSALEIIHGPGHSFSIHLLLLELMEIACSTVISFSHLNKFVLHSPFFIVPVAPVHLSIREGDFLASIHPVGCLSSVPALQNSWRFFGSYRLGWSASSLPCAFRLSPTVRCSPVLQWSLRGLRPTEFRFSGTCPLVVLSLVAMALNSVQDLLSLCHSLGIVLKKE